MKPKNFLISCCLFLVSFYCHAQQFGGNPPGKKWLQLDSDSFRIIFPLPLTDKALEIASILKAVPPSDFDRLNQFRKVDIVLQRGPLRSNGYVGMGPFRSEFFMTPPQNSFRQGGIPWHKTLALHEYRHVQQYNSFNKGISRVIGTVMGEEARALANGLAVPDYFWEGDAVFQETNLTRLGRGRIPYFYNNFWSLWAAQRNYNYAKLRNGSYRDLVPNHYELGFLLVAHGRKKYGEEFWTKVTEDAVRFQGIFYPWQRAVRKYSGQPYKEFVQESLEAFRQNIGSERDSLQVKGQETLHFAGDQLFPQWLDSATIVYLKHSYREIPHFVKRNIVSGAEHRLRVKDIALDYHFSLRDSLIVYAGFQADLRWSWSEYSNIIIYNIENGYHRRIGSKQRYFSPDINPATNQVIAVHIDSSGNSRLDLINAENGSLIKSLPNESNWFFSYPKFLDANRVVVAVSNTLGEMSIARLSNDTNTWELLFPFSINPIAFLQTNGDSILFSRSHNGQDLLFCFVNDSLFQIELPGAGKHAGAYQGAGYRDKWVWTMPAAVGSRLVFAETAGLKFQPFTIDPAADPSPYPLATGSSSLLIDALRSDNNIKPYRKSFRMLNFHSLRPLINDPDYSITLAGENILNEFQSQLSVTYNRNEGFTKLGAAAVYGGWFPLVRGGVSYTFGREAYRNNRRMVWQEAELFAGYGLPLNFSSGRWYRQLSFNQNFVYSRQFLAPPFKDSFDTKPFVYSDVGLQFTNQIQKARQHIFPRLAQSVYLNYKRDLRNNGHAQLLGSGNFYFPGVLNNHSLAIHAGFQQRDSGRVIFTNSFPFSRGYGAANYRKMFRLGASYHFPVLYPERGFANIIYLSRVRTAAFYDHTTAFSENIQQKRFFRSTGLELYFDTKWWNQQDITFGLRLSRLLDRDLSSGAGSRIEFILPLNLIP